MAREKLPTPPTQDEPQPTEKLSRRKGYRQRHGSEDDVDTSRDDPKLRRRSTRAERLARNREETPPIGSGAETGDDTAIEGKLGDLSHLLENVPGPDAAAEAFVPLPRTEKGDWAAFFGVSPDSPKGELDASIDAKVRDLNRQYDREWKNESYERRAVFAKKKIGAMLDAYKAYKQIIRGSGPQPEHVPVAREHSLVRVERSPTEEQPSVEKPPKVRGKHPSTERLTFHLPASIEATEHPSAQQVEHMIAGTRTLPELAAMLRSLKEVPLDDGTYGDAGKMADTIELMMASVRHAHERAQGTPTEKIASIRVANKQWGLFRELFPEKAGIRLHTRLFLAKFPHTLHGEGGHDDVSKRSVVNAPPTIAAAHEPEVPIAAIETHEISPAPDLEIPGINMDEPVVAAPEAAEPPLDLPLIPPAASEQVPEQMPQITLDEARQRYMHAIKVMEYERTHASRVVDAVAKVVPWFFKGSIPSEQRREEARRELDVARNAHIEARARVAQRMIAEQEQKLRDRGLSDEKVAQELASFKALEVFNKLIVEEEQYFDQAKVEMKAGRDKSFVRRTFEKWNSLPQPARVAISTVILGAGMALTGTWAVAGVAGAAKWGGARVLRASAGVAGAQVVGYGAGKGYDKFIGKEKEQQAEEQKELARKRMKENIEHTAESLKGFLEGVQQDYQKGIDISYKNKRNRAIFKGAASALVIGGAALSEALIEISNAASNAASIHDGIPDAPEPRAAEAAAAPTLEHIGITDPNAPVDLDLDRSDTVMPERPLEHSALTTAAETTTPSVVIEPNGTLWDASQELRERLRLSDEQYAEAWANSGIADKHLVHAGDTLSWNAETGRFEFHPSAETVAEAVMEAPATAPKLEHVGITDPNAPVELSLEQPHAVPESVLDTDNDAWREAAHERAVPEGYEDQSWREATHERAVPPPEPGTEPWRTAEHERAAPPSEGGDAAQRMQERFAALRPDTPAFEAVKNDYVRTGLQEVFGERFERSPKWYALKREVAGEFLRISESNYAEGSEPLKLRRYLDALSKETGLRPRFGIFRRETIEHFIERANERKLSLDVSAARASLSR